jgi:hypothetical protein
VHNLQITDEMPERHLNDQNIEPKQRNGQGVTRESQLRYPMGTIVCPPEPAKGTAPTTLRMKPDRHEDKNQEVGSRRDGSEVEAKLKRSQSSPFDKRGSTHATSKRPCLPPELAKCIAPAGSPRTNILNQHTVKGNS